MIVGAGKPIRDCDVVELIAEGSDNPAELRPDTMRIELEREIHLFEPGTTDAEQVGSVEHLFTGHTSAPGGLDSGQEMPEEDAFRHRLSAGASTEMDRLRMRTTTAAAISS
jgi:hypothetical protein